MDDHADHALPESASRFARLHDGAFSERLFNNLRILGDIYQFEIISNDPLNKDALTTAENIIRTEWIQCGESWFSRSQKTNPFGAFFGAREPGPPKYQF